MEGGRFEMKDREFRFSGNKNDTAMRERRESQRKRAMKIV